MLENQPDDKLRKNVSVFLVEVGDVRGRVLSKDVLADALVRER